MRCPFQWVENKHTTYTNREFALCMGDCCPAYIPERTIGKSGLTAPVACKLCRDPMSYASISGQTAAALEAMGRNANGGAEDGK